MSQATLSEIISQTDLQFPSDGRTTPVKQSPVWIGKAGDWLLTGSAIALMIATFASVAMTSFFALRAVFQAFAG